MNRSIALLSFLGIYLAFNTVFAQVSKDEYRTPYEIYEKGAELYMDEEYDKAYEEFMKVNYNDTAYFDSRKMAIECLSAQDKYDTIIELSKEVLSVRKRNPFKMEFLNSMGHAMIQKDRFDDAIAHFDKALEEFPRNYLFYFNRANAYYQKEMYDEAVRDLQTCIRYNPKYYFAHLKLGLICAQAGDNTKAALCLNMGIFLNATESNAITAIGVLETLYGGGLEKEIDKINYREDEDFSDVDLLIENKVAENPKYKVKVKLPLKFIKYNHLVFEQLSYDENSNGFWNQNYVKFFQEVFDKGEFANFSYLECISVDESSIQSVIKKKKSGITEFARWGYSYNEECMNDRMVYDGNGYVKNNLRHGKGGFGFNEEVEMVDGKRRGPAIEYNTHGLVKGKGTFNNDGDLDGVYSSFDEKGRIENKLTFNDGNLEGTMTTYYQNGSRKKVMTVKDGRLSGEILTYYNFNQLFSKVPINEYGKEDGVAEYYYGTGDISKKINYKSGSLDGEFLSYYSNGQLEEKVNYSEGSRTGEFKAYHKNGAIAAEGQYEDGKRVGHWKFTHDNGQLDEEGDYRDGYRIGVWEEYNANGKLSNITDYGETGKKTGVYKKYDLDGNLLLELTYKGNEIISYKTYNDGDVAAEGEKKKKELDFVDYHSNGKIKTEGSYYKGEQIGKWKHYNKSGVLTSEFNYLEGGNIDGEAKWYFNNGKVETIKNFKDGQTDGYYVYYYKNGNIYKHGWYREGELVGAWEYYYPDGSLQKKEYFLEDEPHGETEFYDEKGRLVEISLNYYGTFQGSILFDTLGNERARYMLNDGEGKLEYTDLSGAPSVTNNYKGAELHGERISYHSNGQLLSKGMVSNGYYMGEWKWYYDNGELNTVGSYVDGDRDGKWIWYHKNGKVSLERNYVKGKIEGLETSYYENGVKEYEKNYRNDERHGESTYFDEAGEVQLIRYYQDGLMIGYSYLGADGKPVKMIPFDNLEGTMEAYFKNGKKSYHSVYANGYNQGKTIYYHSNGKEADTREYKDSQLHGTFYRYYSSGKVMEELEYQYGDLHGTSKKYYANGKLKSVEHYLWDDLYGWAEYYDEKGNLTSRKYYYNDDLIK